MMPALPPLDNLMASCIEIADRAGRAILDIYEQGCGGMAFKDDSSPLTEADLAANRIIVGALRKLTPDIEVISEEEAGRPEGCGRFWLVDPLDGTREFISRNGEFTVNIALIESGAAILGVIAAPCIGLAYAGGRSLAARKRDGAGTWKNIAVGVPPDGPRTVVLSRSHPSPGSDQWMAANHPQAVCIEKGSSLKFCMVAEGAAHLYPRFGPTMEWDTAAGQAILTAAGGKVVDGAGQRLKYGKAGFKNPPFFALI